MGTAGPRGGQRLRPILSKVVLAALLFVAGVALLATASFYILPLSIAEQGVKESLRAQGALVSWQSLGRTFPFGLKATGVRFDDIATGRPVVRLDEARVRLALSGLLHGSLRFPIEARMVGGVITGRADIGRKGASLDMEAAGVEIGSLPLLEGRGSGVSASGTAGGALSVFVPWRGCPSGLVRLRSGRIDGGGASFMGLPLPLGDIEQAGLNATLGDCKVVVEGMWVDASELSARLSGLLVPASPLAASRLEMTLEITPKGDLSGKQWFLSFMAPYRRSANYYYMTIRGTLSRPVMGR